VTRLTLLRLLPAIAAASLACSRSGERLSVALITLDTTRRDALGCFGGRPEIAPNLDRLAAESLRYDQARTVAPLTLPAHASMFTGLFPPRHGVRENGPARLSSAATTLAESALAAGYETAGFVGGLTLDRAYGTAQGFEHWTQPPPAPRPEPGIIADRPASAVVADARRWLEGRDRERPFFLWVHVFDAHAPYAPPAGSLERARGDAYLGEVAACDAALGELFGDLERDGLLDRMLLVVVADHGEALGEHGEDTHGLLCYDATIRVPMLVRHPDGWRAGEAADEEVSVADVCPTLLEAMQVQVPDGLDGLSLYRRGAPEERGVYFESHVGWARFGWSPIAGWCDAEGKYAHSSSPQFFRVRGDPGETRDEIAALGPGADRYRGRIQAVHSAPRIEADPTELAPVSAEDPVAELGYGDSHDFLPDYPDPLAPTDRPAPHERTGEHRVYLQANAHIEAGQPAEAAAALEPIVAAEPWNRSALDALALALADLRLWRRAIDVLLQRLDLPPERLSTHRLLVRCYTELGDEARARAHTLRSLELMIELHERRGEPEIAERYRELHRQGLRGE
jgi:arylsulfatase A-like enzyme